MDDLDTVSKLQQFYVEARELDIWLKIHHNKVATMEQKLKNTIVEIKSLMI